MATLSVGRNPWLVHDISDFNFLCCPECDYRARCEETFEHHAIGKHPLAIYFFAAEVKEPKDLNNRTNELDFSESEHITEAMKDEQEHILEAENDKEDDNSEAQVDNEEQLENEGVEESIEHVGAKDCDTNDSESLQCPKCDQFVIGLIELGMHLNNEHVKVKNKWQCPTCSVAFGTSSKMKRHVESVHLRIRIKCKLCDSKMAKDSIKDHMRNFHNGDRINKPFRCNLCDFSSHALKYLKAHKYIKHDFEKHKFCCDQCEEKFAFPHMLREHKEVKHEGIKKFLCENCGLKFTNKWWLHLHLNGPCGGNKAPTTKRQKKDPTGDAPPAEIQCDKCPDSFSAENYYRIHYKHIHGENPPPLSDDRRELMCDQCPNVYITQQGLYYHIQACHIEVPRKRKVTQRIKTCPHCDKTFSTFLCYKEHIAAKHDMSTPHKCDQCSRSYGTKVKLRTHIRNVHQRVNCDECNQEICNDFMLKRHKASVHNIKPENVFQCEQCPLFYCQKKTLENHVNKIHSMK